MTLAFAEAILVSACALTVVEMTALLTKLDGRQCTAKNGGCCNPSGAIHADLSLAKKPLRTTSRIFGGPIHAAVGNRQQRSDH